MAYEQFLKFGWDGLKRPIKSRDDIQKFALSLVFSGGPGGPAHIFSIELEDGNKYDLLIDVIKQVPCERGNIFFFRAELAVIDSFTDQPVWKRSDPSMACSGILIF